MARKFNIGDLKTYKNGQRFVQSTEGKQIHVNTVRLNLIQEGFRTYTQSDHRTIKDWKKVMFSDETMISRIRSFGKAYYHSRPDHRRFQR